MPDQVKLTLFVNGDPASAKLTEAVQDAIRQALECADRVIDGKICWHGREAVAAALIEIAVGNMADNLHDDPEQYEGDVEDLLAR